MFCAASAPASPSRASVCSMSLATTRKGHHLRPRVAVKLPSPGMARNPDFVSELLNLSGQFRAVNCRGEGLRAIDLDRIEAAPLSIGPPGHVCDDDVGVEVRVGTVAVLNAAGGTSRDMIETCGDNIAGHDPFAAPAATRECILFEFHERSTDCFPVRFDKAVIVSNQPLNAHRLRCVEGGVPASSPVVAAIRFVNEHLAGGRAKPAEHGAEVFGRDLATESQLLSAA